MGMLTIAAASKNPNTDTHNTLWTENDASEEQKAVDSEWPDAMVRPSKYVSGVAQR